MVFPAVLLLVGSGAGNRYEDAPASVTVDKKPALLFKGIEEQLIARDIAVFVYDKRGVTPKDATFQDEDVNREIFSKTADAEHLASDALHAFDALRTMPEIDPSRVSVLGHSEGTALAMKIVEERPEVRSLLMLGLWTRNFEQIGYYQGVINLMRLFEVMDADQDGYLTREEVLPFIADSQGQIQAWDDQTFEGRLLPGIRSVFDATGDGRVSEQEWRYVFEQQHKYGELQIHDPSMPWRSLKPRSWAAQYEAEGDYLPRHIQFCAKIHVFHGEIDIQTPFEDALELRDSCQDRGTPLASFHSYPGEGHAFSPRTGLKGWRDTIGPMDPQLQRDIAEAAARDLLN